MKTKYIKLIFILAAVIIGFGVFGRHYYLPSQGSARSGHHEIWYCPMHPQILYDHPGRCPICGMDLVKKEEPSPQQQGAAVEGYTTINESSQKQQLAGVRTEVVVKKGLVKVIRAAGEYEGEVFAQVFENDLAYIKVGQKVVVEVPAFHQKYEGAVNSIDSSIDESTRTIRVRIWLKQNNQKLFKANMFVNVYIPVELNDAVVVPREAVMDTGLHKIVFVQKDEGTFVPREVQTGMETDEGYEIKSGLKAGERIVVSGNFLLDSESRVQAGIEQGAAHE
jgi:Cu(I)/Ag(I) efflux system membrane fusion protein